MYNTKLCIAQLTDPTEPIHFVYWKCTSSPGSHPTENRSCLKDGMDWISAPRCVLFYFVCFYLPCCGNSDTRSRKCTFWIKVTFFCICLKCLALEQSLHVSWHSTAYSAAYFKHWELFKVNFKNNGPRNEKWFIEIILQRNAVTENRSNTKKLLQLTGLKNNLGRGIYPTTYSFSFIFKTRYITSGVSDPL